MKCPYRKKVTKCVTNEKYRYMSKTDIAVDFMECSKSECPYYTERNVRKDYRWVAIPECRKVEKEVE